MKIQANCQNLINVLSALIDIAKSNKINEMLTNALIVVSEEEVKISTTNLNVLATIVVDDCKIEQPGSSMINASTLLSLSKEIKEKYIAVENDKRNILITTDDGQFILNGEDHTKFPEIPTGSSLDFIHIESIIFSKMIRKCAFVSTTEMSKYDLGNVLVDIKKEKIRLVATDGKRMSITEHEAEIPESMINQKIYIPATSFQFCKKIVEASNGVKIRFSDSHFLLYNNTTFFCCRIANAKFPPYEKVIPKKLLYKINIDKKILLSAIKRTMVLQSEKAPAIELTFNTGKLEVSTTSSSNGKAKIILPAQFDHDKIKIKINPKYLVEILTKIEDQEISLEVSNSHSALRIIADNILQYIMLPIKEI